MWRIYMKNQIMFDCINMKNMLFTVKMLFFKNLITGFFLILTQHSTEINFCFMEYQLLNISNVSGLITQMHNKKKIKIHSPA